MIAGLLLLYTIWTVKHSVSYVKAMVTQGQLTIKGNGHSIASFYMSSCAQYAFFAIVLFTLGWMVQRGPFGRSDLSANQSSDPAGSIQNCGEARDGDDDEDDFEDWFQRDERPVHPPKPN